jgi:hypothetical protein
MRFMEGWTWADYQDCPASVVDRIVEVIQEEARRAEADRRRVTRQKLR